MLGKIGMILLGGLLVGVLALSAGMQGAAAQSATLRLSASPELIESGLMRFLIPRFSLKTGIDIYLQPIGSMDEAATGADVVILRAQPGRRQPPGTVPVIEDAASGVTYDLIVTPEAGERRPVHRFVAWLTGEIGRRTIAQFAIDGEQAYRAAEPEVMQAGETVFEGDAANGGRLSQAHCGRCHVIDTDNRMRGIGSTPSFPALRALTDWQERFETFYVRNPHPAVVQVAGITTPFHAALPPPIPPVEITQDDLEDILTYVAALTPADLGEPVRHQ